MPFFLQNPRLLERRPLVGSGSCIEIVKQLVPGLKGVPTSAWRQGARVLDTSALRPGTAIATFEDGRYPNRPHGNHAALFVAYGGQAIWVMDQWKGDPRRTWIGLRLIAPGRQYHDGSFIDPSNAAQAFYVIER
jgi:hypothetical protein